MSDDKKRERFKKLAEARTNKIIDTLRLLGNCSNKSFYDYSDDDVKQIFGAIEKALKDTKSKFSGKPEERHKFTLKD